MVTNMKRVVRAAPAGETGADRPGRTGTPRPAAPHTRPPGANGNGRQGPALTKTELEDMKEALLEYERTRGDWSKSR